MKPEPTEGEPINSTLLGIYDNEADACGFDPNEIDMIPLSEGEIERPLYLPERALINNWDGEIYITERGTKYQGIYYCVKVLPNGHKLSVILKEPMLTMKLKEPPNQFTIDKFVITNLSGVSWNIIDENETDLPVYFRMANSGITNNIAHHTFSTEVCIYQIKDLDDMSVALHEMGHASHSTMLSDEEIDIQKNSRSVVALAQGVDLLSDVELLLRVEEDCGLTLQEAIKIVHDSEDYAHKWQSAKLHGAESLLGIPEDVIAHLMYSREADLLTYDRFLFPETGASTRVKGIQKEIKDLFLSNYELIRDMQSSFDELKMSLGYESSDQQVEVEYDGAQIRIRQNIFGYEYRVIRPHDGVRDITTLDLSFFGLTIQYIQNLGTKSMDGSGEYSEEYVDISFVDHDDLEAAFEDGRLKLIEDLIIDLKEVFEYLRNNAKV